MSEKKVQVLTVKQAKAQMNRFGLPLILYILVFLFLHYGTNIIEDYFPELFMGYDPVIVMMIIAAILLILITFIGFSLGAKKLNLKMQDYTQSAKCSVGRIFVYSCTGIGIYLITTSISSLFYFFFHTEHTLYPFLGQFTNVELIIQNIGYLLLMVVLKPICDEYVFRGIILRHLGHYARYFGIIASSALYAISQGSLVEAVPAFFVGWFLSIITVRYHSIKPTIFIHLFVSLFVWAINILPQQLLWVVIILIIGIYIVCALSIFQKKIPYQISTANVFNAQYWKILCTSSTIIICILLFIVNIVLSFQF